MRRQSFLNRHLLVTIIILLLGAVTACQPAAAPVAPLAGATAAAGLPTLTVLAAESFIADMAQNVAGDRLKVETLMSLGLDPHAFEPTPQDVARIADSQVLIVNGGGFEGWLQEVLDNAGGQRQVIEAAAGLTSRSAREGEAAEMSDEELGVSELSGFQTEETPLPVAPDGGHQQHDGGDPHFWLDPSKAIVYVENIRDGLSQADPAGKAIYAANAAAYIAQLQELDSWIAQQTQSIPAEHRQIVTNHESFGYFADRYGFTIIGTVVPSISTGSAPSAQQLARLIDRIKASGAPAIFLETGANPQLAQQVAAETGVAVVTDLYTHSITSADGPAPTYIAMLRHNVQAMLDALK